jgi:tetratricopeptide (TPR) repeat protein
VTSSDTIAEKRSSSVTADQRLSEVDAESSTISQAAPDELLAYLSQSNQEALLRQRAMDHAQQGQIDEAIALFTLLIDYNPNSASNYNNRGLLYFRQGCPHLALADYNRALRLNSRLAKIYNNRANCFASLGKLESAIADYETAIDLDPTDIRSRLNQGITFRDLEVYDRAIESFDLALQFSQLLNSTDMPGVPVALEGHVYAERGRTYHVLGDWNCAIADYHRALARLPIADSVSGVSYRLRLQVNSWFDELLQPLQRPQNEF